MEAAVKAAKEHEARTGRRPLLVGVTALTSLNDEILKDMGIFREKMQPLEMVVRLARIAEEIGLDGVVSSPREAEELRKWVGKDFIIVTPGIREEGDDKADQERTATPAQAIRWGANYLVVGRPITGKPNRADAGSRFIFQVEEALSAMA